MSRSRSSSISLADILRNASSDVLAANGLARRVDTPATPAPLKTSHRKPKQKGPSEHDEQVRLFKMIEDYPALCTLFAIPNGGYRTKATAGKLKAEGVRAGVPDLFLPVASRGYHGMFVEMKVTGNKPTDNQKDWLQKLANNGYYCVVAYGADVALERLLWYTKEENKPC